MEYKVYEKLTISDDFMFTKVMSDEHLLKELIRRIIPDLVIKDFRIVIKEMTINEFFGSRGIRFDVFAVNDEFLFCVEMQVSKKNFSVKRARYYQGIADVSDLPAGHIEGAAKGREYDMLKKQYIIFICPFDPFDDNLFMYTFTNRCHETDKELNDGTTKIFINCTGKNIDEHPLLKPFAQYVMGSFSDDDYVREVDESVRTARLSPLWRKEYMDLQEKLWIARQEGRSEERTILVKRLCSTGMTFEEACEALMLTEEEIISLKKVMESQD